MGKEKKFTDAHLKVFLLFNKVFNCTQDIAVNMANVACDEPLSKFAYNSNVNNSKEKSDKIVEQFKEILGVNSAEDIMRQVVALDARLDVIDSKIERINDATREHKEILDSIYEDDNLLVEHVSAEDLDIDEEYQHEKTESLP